MPANRTITIKTDWWKRITLTLYLAALRHAANALMTAVTPTPATRP
jgi:hypothetical protein